MKSNKRSVLTMGIILVTIIAISACSLILGDDRASMTMDATTNTVTIDSNAPTVTISTPSGDISISSNSYIITGTASDETALEGIYLSRNSSSFKNFSVFTNWSTNIINLAEGSNVIAVYSKDTAGNISSTNSIMIWVDSGVPVLTIDPQACSTNLVFTALLSVDEDYGYWSTNSSPFVQFTTTGTSVDISTNTTLLYYSADILSNTSSTQTVEYTVDLIAPTVSIDALPAITNVSSLDVTVSISDDNSGIQAQYYMVDSGSATTFTGNSFNLIGLSDASHTIYVWSIDNVNNISATNNVSITVDTTAPNVPIVTGSADSMDTKPAWDWNIVVDAVKYRYSYTDGSGWTETNATNFTPASDLTFGTYTLYVQAADSLDNWSSSGSKTIKVLPIFTEINSGSLTGVYRSSIDLGDIDNDGDLDLILTGSDFQSGGYTAITYTNDGSGGFTEINPSSLTAVAQSSVDFGDIDNDGDLDLILTGTDGNGKSKIYRNNGSGGFTEIYAGSLTAVYASSVKLADIDGDTDLDLILTGSGNAKIYRNSGTGSFTEINPGSLMGVENSSIDLGDIDGDTDLDLILTGWKSGTGRVTCTYVNDGAGAFTEINPGSISTVHAGSQKFADIDNDGDLDLILTGVTTSAIAEIYTNDGSGAFTEINSGSLTGVLGSSIDLGDIDNDGDLDLILTGDKKSKIYLNNGAGGFTEVDSGSLTGVGESSIKLGDIDDDGDLDLILTGERALFSYISKIYRNNISNN